MDSIEEIKQIFAEAIELPAEQRAAFLDRRCGGNARLRAAVEELIAGDEQAGGFFAVPTIDSSDANEDSQPLAAMPPQIGPYKLLESIGEGGFGTVYLAEQEHPVRRRVALKIIKLGMDTRQVIARFEAERQALAMMDHANIARVFDAGATQTGRPYFVMELVRGVPVTQYCDANRLTPRQRLELFVPICQAVQHAHQKGIIHRDLKPSNVLITLQDGTPVPKVIDFGIAKATQARLTEKTVFTELRQMIGTPEYMSPEQAETSDVDADTRSDVYSLGVLLYELLTGATPFDAKDLRSRAFGEIQRVIREVEPPHPSTRLSTLETLANVAAQRSIEPRKLSALVRGELDWIVMKCLEKDRGRRYESASALAGDVLHYLADEPVQAGPPSQTYRLRKLVRRHKLAIATAGVVLFALTAGLTVATWGLVRARRERDNAVAARVAEAESRELSEQINTFVERMFESINPAQARGKPVLVRDILDAAVKRLDGAFPNRPYIEGHLRMFFGHTYLSLGMPQQSLEQFDRAVALLKSNEDPTWYAEALYNAGCAQVYVTRFDDAAWSFRETIRVVSSHDRPGAAVLLNQAKARLAQLLMHQNKLDEASALYEEVLAFRRVQFGPESEDTLRTITDIAWIRQLQGRFAESETMLRDAVETGRRSRGPDSPYVLAYENSLAQALADDGKPEEAEQILRHIVSEASRIMGPEHLNTLIAMSMHGKILIQLRRFAEAQAVLEPCISSLKSSVGEDHLNTLIARNQLPSALIGQKKYDQADLEYRDLCERLVKKLGPEHPETLMALSNSALLGAEHFGRLKPAEQTLRDLVPRMTKAMGPEHPVTLLAINWLGEVLDRQSRWADAEPLLKQAFDGAVKAKLLAAHPEFRTEYATCLEHLGRSAEAKALPATAPSTAPAPASSAAGPK